MDVFESIKRKFDGSDRGHRLLLLMDLQDNRPDYDSVSRKIILTR